MGIGNYYMGHYVVCFYSFFLVIFVHPILPVLVINRIIIINQNILKKAKQLLKWKTFFSLMHNSNVLYIVHDCWHKQQNAKSRSRLKYVFYSMLTAIWFFFLILHNNKKYYKFTTCNELLKQYQIFNRKKTTKIFSSISNRGLQIPQTSLFLYIFSSFP